MPEKVTLYRVFISTPRGLEQERRAFASTLEKYNRAVILLDGYVKGHGRDNRGVCGTNYWRGWQEFYGKDSVRRSVEAKTLHQHDHFHVGGNY
jgi:hypothetical protein